jgi:hypothetical protein
MTFTARLPSLLLSIACLSVIAGCASITSVPPGTNIDVVIKQFGEPAVRCPGSTGHERLVWTAQPMGQTAWATELSTDGRVSGFEQVLTDAHFSVLSNPGWTKDKIHCEFGPPAEIEDLGMGFSDKHTTWLYRFMHLSTWYSFMAITFGDDGQHVLKYGSVPDPMFDEGSRGFSVD